MNSQTVQDLPGPWLRLEPGQGAGLEREAAIEIGPDHELSGHQLTAIARCKACDDVAFRVDDFTYAIVHLTYAHRRMPEPAPYPETQRLGGYLALKSAIEAHATEAHGFSEQAALKVLYLAIRNLEEFRTPNTGIRSSGWKQALQAFTIYFDGRIPTP
jgi:hypothetical protein